MPQRSAYLNGSWIDERDLALPVADIGFAMGVTITERLRTFGGRLWRLEEHVARLRRSAEIVGLAESVALEIGAAITEWVARHEPTRPDGDDWSVVAFATPGAGGEPTRCVHGMPLPFARWADDYARGVTLRTSVFREAPADCWPAELKHRSRMHYYLADREAAAAEPGAQALLLDQRGFVCQTAIANVVAYREADGVFSPRLSEALPGVSVAVLRELAEAAGVEFTERDLTVDELLTADEIWLASTSVCLLPVARLDGQPIGPSAPGPAYTRMLAAWDRAAGLDIAEQARKFAARS